MLQQVPWLLANWPALAISVGIFLGSLLLLGLLRWRLAAFLDSRLIRFDWYAAPKTRRRLASASWMLVLLLAASAALRWAPLSESVRLALARIGVTAALLVFTLVLVQAARALATSWSDSQHLPLELAGLFGSVVQGFVWLAFILIGLALWSVPTTPVALAFSVIVIVAAIALRDLVGNWVNYAFFRSTRPVQEGDHIRLDSGEEGIVLGISWQSVALRGDSGEHITVPLGKFLQATVTNFGRPIRAGHPKFYSTVPYVGGNTQLPRDRSELRDWLVRQPLRQSLWTVFLSWLRDGLGDIDVAAAIERIDPARFTLESLRSALVVAVDEQLPPVQRHFAPR